MVVITADYDRNRLQLCCNILLNLLSTITGYLRMVKSIAFIPLDFDFQQF